MKNLRSKNQHINTGTLKIFSAFAVVRLLNIMNANNYSPYQKNFINLFLILPMPLIEKPKSVILITGLIAAIALILFLNPFVIVHAGERGVLLQFGSVAGVLEPGFHLRIPIVQNVSMIDVKIQKEQVEADAASKDLQTIHATVALNFNVDPKSVSNLYQEVGEDYINRIIDPAMQESVKAITAKYTAEELITKRASVKDEIKLSLTDRLKTTYLNVDDFSIVNFDFSDEFNSAIEAKQTAVQQALKAENDLRRIEIEAKQQIEKAKADAESIRIQGEALKQNQDLVQLKAVEKWNGQLPVYMMGNTVPFLNISK